MWRRQCHGSPWPGALLLSPHTILHSDLALPRVRLTLGGGSSLCRLSGGLPANHTAAFPEASLGRGSLHLESGKESSSFPPLLLDNVLVPRASRRKSLARRSGLLGDPGEWT